MRLFIFLFTIFCSLPGYSLQTAGDILFIHSYDSQHQWTAGIRQGFTETLKRHSLINVQHEYMDAKRFPDKKHQERFYQYIVDKYADQTLRAIVISDDPAMNMYLANRNNSFHDLPVFFMGINKVNPAIVEAEHMAGVFENRALQQAVIDIKHVLDSDEIIIISDSSLTGRANSEKLLAATKHDLAPKTAYLLEDLTPRNFINHIYEYPSDVPILIAGQLRSEKTQELLSWHKTFEQIGTHISNPFFALGTFALDYGALGGYQLDPVKHAQQATTLLIHYLDGTPLSQIDSVTEVKSTWYWSMSKLSLFGIMGKDLPKNSIVRDWHTVTYELDSKSVVAYLALMLGSMLIIILLLIAIRKTKQSETILLDKVSLTEKLTYEASHDYLTGLFNRRCFTAKMDELEKKQFSSAPGTNVYIAILDLDNFKVVNDTVGHMVGDSLLTEVSQIMRDNTGPDEALARLSGIEFALIFQDKQKKYVQKVCSDIINAVTKYRLFWNNSHYSVGINIGVVRAHHSDRTEKLISHANIACQKAKHSGKNKAYMTDSSDRSIKTELVQLGHIADIANALENNQFFLAKQKIQHLSNADQEHYEILLRYTDKEGNPVPPGLFIPAAEQYGLITLVDEWVVRNVLQKYEEFFPPNTTVSINLSAISVCSEAFLQSVLDIISKSNVDMTRVCFEVTETAVASHIDKAIHFIRTLKITGCKFALDDFGSGSASYGYLKKLPVDYLKIDGSLIKNIVSEPIDQTIVKSITEIAHEMGMLAIAEFVEDNQCIEILKDIGVDYGQGFGIHKPEAC